MSSLIYIHGFKGSAKGVKGQQLKNLMLELGAISRFRAPNLLIYPSQAIVQLETLIVQLDNPTLVGNSLGGYYATYLAEKFKLKALLVNPVVLPHKLTGKVFNENDDLKSLEDETANKLRQILKDVYESSDESFVDDYLKELANLEMPPPTDKSRYKVWLKKGDQVIDYRFAKEWYKDCDLTIDEGGDHHFDDFGARFETLLEWAELK